jgi:hypothetical protein
MTPIHDILKPENPAKSADIYPVPSNLSPLDQSGVFRVADASLLREVAQAAEQARIQQEKERQKLIEEVKAALPNVHPSAIDKDMQALLDRLGSLNPEELSALITKISRDINTPNVAKDTNKD